MFSSLTLLIVLNLPIATAVPMVKCSLSLESAAPVSWTERAWRKAPAILRELRREWRPDAATSELAAIHAELKTLIPYDVVTPTLTGVVGPDARDFVADFKDHPAWFKNLNRAETVLKDALRLTEHVHGSRSAPSGLAHFALSVFYTIASDQESPIRGHSSPDRDTLGAYFRLSEVHAREATRLLGWTNDQRSKLVRIHWIKILTRGAERLSPGSGLGGRDQAPPEYYFWIADAEREAKAFAAQYSTAPRGESLTMYLQVSLCLATIERMTSFDPTASIPSLAFRTRQTFETVLNDAVSGTDEDLAELISHRRGVLHEIVNRLRWATIDDDKDYADRLFQIENRLRSTEPPSVAWVRHRLADLGFGRDQLSH